MSTKSEAGKRRWRGHADRYPDELRRRIENEAAERYARWQLRGQAPLWMRLKLAVRRWTIALQASSRNAMR